MTARQKNIETRQRIERAKKARSFAGKVRIIIKSLGGEVKVKDITDALDLVSAREKSKVYTALRDLLRDGSIIRTEPGVYVDAKKKEAPQIKEKMWRILQVRKRVRVVDLQELCGASSDYASQWLRLLEKRGVVKRSGAYCRLVKNVAEMPENHEKSDYLKDLRKAKKEALAALKQASLAVNNARVAVEKINANKNS